MLCMRVTLRTSDDSHSYDMGIASEREKSGPCGFVRLYKSTRLLDKFVSF